ncbi:MAG: lipoyl(octanoyl) transferase LipB [Bacteroidota bacterium]|nr:lipoyl(octanoyl) transferase LipB [Bacteroidota bacterium]MDP4193819.1 lipoyl(octanoyl) transferase LipB [Bacteroidota bacterium]
MERQFTFREIDYFDLGMIAYDNAWDLQKKTFELRRNNSINDTLYLLEHPNTYTLGKVTDKANLISSEEFLKKNNISIFEIDRGGDITYHGPGQIVGYPIIDLKLWKEDTHLYLRGLEEVIIRTCKDYGINATRIDKLTGVWIDHRKIAAIGIKVSRWITMHGFAFNVNTDLSLFNGIIPCGIKDKEVTSLKKELGMEINLSEVKSRLVSNFSEVFSYDKVNEQNKREIIHPVQ